MILTKEQLDEYRSELPRSVWNKRCLTNFLDTIADLESRLKAEITKWECVYGELAKRKYDLESSIRSKDIEIEILRGSVENYIKIVRIYEDDTTEKSNCGHPKMFARSRTMSETNIYTGMGDFIGTNFDILFSCTLCAEVQAAYERGLRDAFDSIKDTFTENARPVILKVILALKDRGAKGGRG
jgi:hypothetical protein